MNRARTIALFALLLFGTAGSQSALGRAGGGGSFSGSSSPSSSSYGSSSYSSRSDYGSSGHRGSRHQYHSIWEVLFDIAFCGGGIAVALFFFWIYDRITYGRDGNTESMRANSYRPRPMARKKGAVRVINPSPDFDASEFLPRFLKAFTHIQRAWCSQNLQSIRHFISDGIQERFELQISEQQDMGYRDHMEQLSIRSARVAEAKSSGMFDVITVEVTASAIDYRVSLDSGAYLSGNRSPDQFTEFWSFVRRSGFESEMPERGLIEGHCPNCGFKLKMNRFEKCSSCEAWLKSGEYDWVLAEITQGCVWQPGWGRTSSLANRFRKTKDPGFNIQHLEDRASVIFWRKAMADRLGNIKPLLKVATADFCRGVVFDRAKPGDRKKRTYRGGCSVGTIELLGFTGDSKHDFALVEVHWSSHLHAADSKGEVQDLGDWKRQKSLLVLMRRKGTKTKIEHSIDSAHCPNCGAPESELASHSCESCDSVLNDGRYDWVLWESHRLSSTAARQWLARGEESAQQSNRQDEAEPSYADLLAWATKVFAADKVLDKDEQMVIRQLARKQGMSTAMLMDLINRQKKGELDAEGPSSPRSIRTWLVMMVDVALIDGTIDQGERRLLVDLGKSVGLKQPQVELLIDKQRSKRSRESSFLEAIASDGIEL